MSNGGEVFILDMGEQLRIFDLAKKLIHLSGRNIAAEPGGEGIEIIEVGLRPGEKMFEELLISGDQLGTSNPKIFKSKEKFPSPESMKVLIADLREAVQNYDHIKILEIFENNVEGYVYEKK
jgi:FlaA1/EpsC-like NDP-sugar epimerase